MENFKGTKGKWWTEESFDGKYNQAVVNINSGEHAESFITIWSGQGIISDTDKANAKLIACAPEMLEMLQSIVGKPAFKEYFPATRIEVLELIEKATTI